MARPPSPPRPRSRAESRLRAAASAASPRPQTARRRVAGGPLGPSFGFLGAPYSIRSWWPWQCLAEAIHLRAVIALTARCMGQRLQLRLQCLLVQPIYEVSLRQGVEDVRGLRTKTAGLQSEPQGVLRPEKVPLGGRWRRATPGCSGPRDFAGPGLGSAEAPPRRPSCHPCGRPGSPSRTRAWGLPESPGACAR